MDQYNKIILFIAWIMVSFKFLMVAAYAWYGSFMSDSVHFKNLYLVLSRLQAVQY